MADSQKSLLRKNLYALRKNMTKDYKSWADRSLIVKLQLAFDLQNRKKVGLYFPIGSEPDVMPIISSHFSDDYQFYFPHTTNDNNLIFYPWSKGDAFSEGRYGTYELKNLCAFPDDVPDIIVVPMLGWSRAGYRLGYGAGCFDRFFAINKQSLKIGLSYSFLEIKDSFSEAHDQRIDIIISEIETIFL